MVRSCLLAVSLAAAHGACATAHDEPNAMPADAAVMPMIDAKQTGNHDAAVQQLDAPSQGSCTQTFTGALATWDFVAETGTQALTPVDSTAPGVLAGPIERAAALTAVSGANAVNSSNWPLGLVPDPAKYYGMTITPPTGCTLQITSVSIDAKSSTTGPAMAVLQTSVDSFGQATPLSTSVVSTPAMSMPAQTQMIELRVSGFAAGSTAGTMRLQGTFTINGSVL